MQSFSLYRRYQGTVGAISALQYVVTKESKMAPTANGKAGERNERQNENHEQI